MFIVSAVFSLIMVGVLIWLIDRYLPSPSAPKRIITMVVVIALVYWLLYGFGLLDFAGGVRAPRLS